MTEKSAFADLLKHYVKGDDYERACAMLDKSEEEFIMYDLNLTDIKKVTQSLFGRVSIRTRTSRSQGYPVAELFVVNKADESAKFNVDVEIDRNITFKEEIAIAAHKSTFEIILCKGDSLSAFVGVPVYIKVVVTDTYGREITSACGELTVVKNLTKPNIELNFNPGKSSDDVLGSLSINSREKSACNLILKMVSEKKIVSIMPISIMPEQSLKNDVVMDSTLYVPFSGKPVLSVECDGYEIYRTTVDGGEINLSSRSNPICPGEGLLATSSMKIFAECSAERIIDFNTQKDGNIILGAIGLLSCETSSQAVTVIVSYDGNPLFTTTGIVAPCTKAVVEATVPMKHIARDDTYQAEVRFTVLDSGKSVILDKIFTMIVRSRFDIDLTKLIEQTAESVSPLDASVQNFIEGSSSPLGKEMGSEFAVTAYQRESRIIPQIESVFNAVKHNNMHYVSSTGTFREGHYQRVRTPAKVLKDHSGNCIELSILYASILEAMGFETVVVFPYGHAIAGVVMETNAYQSSAKLPDVMQEKLLTLRKGDEFCRVLCFETTMCSERSEFKEAVTSAYNTIIRELSSINSRFVFTIVEKERQRGVKPRVE